MAIIKYELNLLEDIKRITQRMCNIYPLYGYFLTSLQKIIVTEDHPYNEIIKTAAICKNPHDISYALAVNEVFWKTLSEDAKLDIIIHEIKHCAYFHPSMSKSFSQKEIFNIAADLEINQGLKNLPDNGMTLQEYTQWIEDNKALLKSGKVVAPMRPCRLEDFKFNEKTEAFMGTKYYYDKLFEMMQNQKDKSPQAQALRQMVNQMQQGIQTSCSHDTWKEFDDVSKEEQEMMDYNTKSTMKRILGSIEEGDRNKMIGTLPGELRDLIADLFKHREPVFNWKAYLRQFVAKSIENMIRSTRAKPNKRLGEDFSTIKIYEKFSVFTGVDTSGSMSDLDIVQCFTEINHIYKTGHTVMVGESDCTFDEKKDLYKFNGKYPVARLGLSGGGGKFVLPFVEI